MRKLFVPVLILTLVIIGSFFGCTLVKNKLEAGHVQDEAMLAGRNADTLAGAEEDYYADMDYGLTKNPEGIRASLDPYLPGISAAEAVKRVAIGRNNWVVWTAGNDRIWDVLSVSSLGNLDLLKTISSHPSLTNKRNNRWSYLGLVNEPCFDAGHRPATRTASASGSMSASGADCPPDPFENETKYPGVRIGARGKNIPAGSYYGYATGVVGLRLFPNPGLRRSRAEDAGTRCATTPTAYYNDTKLVRPYRVGMSCGFCHVGPNPIQSAGRSGEPEMGESQPNPGAQYFWIDRIFMCEPGSGQLHLPALPHLASRRARHVAGLHRQNQQPAHDERGLQPRRASGASAKRGAAETTRRRQRWTTTSSTTTFLPVRR